MLTPPYRLTFTSGAVAGKTMIVQATNTGGDLGENHFDLAMPGGGVGLFNGCSRQWGGIDLGNQNGGFYDRSQCATLPWQWQQACYWRFDWFRNADNPNVEFEEVSCPQAMIDRTGCGRWS
jgi:Glycosyl hydrolase family 45